MYEIMNDLGANVANVLDDNQMAYSNMSQYMELNRIERTHKEPDKASFDLNTVLSRDPSERDFDALWGPGLVMDWSYVPKEDQKTHINWRQSINDDGKGLARLASFPCNEINGGANIVNKKGVGSEVSRNKASMDSFVAKDDDDKLVAEAIAEGKKAIGDRDDAINKLRGEVMNEIKRQCLGTGIDPLIVACIAYFYHKTDYKAIADKLNQMSSNLRTKNKSIMVCAWSTREEVFLGNEDDKYKQIRKEDKERIPRIDHPFYVMKTSEGNNSGGTLAPEEDGININWDGREQWDWIAYAKRYMVRGGRKGYDMNALSLWCKVTYLYAEILPLCMASRFDEERFAFPFTDEELENPGVTYTSAYGWRPAYGRMHYGVDLATEEGTPVHAVTSGTIVSTTWDPQNAVICLQHDDGETYSRYMHNSAILVQEGQHVERGEIIAKVGNVCPWGSGPHLHFELSTGNPLGANKESVYDPLDWYPKLKSMINVGDRLPVA